MIFACLITIFLNFTTHNQSNYFSTKSRNLYASLKWQDIKLGLIGPDLIRRHRIMLLAKDSTSKSLSIGPDKMKIVLQIVQTLPTKPVNLKKALYIKLWCKMSVEMGN